MTKPDPALAFYLRHASDVDALWEEKGVPKDVDPAGWKKFQDVIARTGEKAALVVTQARDGAVEALKDTIITSGYGPQKGTLRESWDAWLAFKLKGKGNKKAIDAVGVMLEAHSTGKPRLVGYLKVSGEGRAKRFSEELKKAGLEPAGAPLAWSIAGVVPVMYVDISDGQDVEQWVEASVAAFVKLKPVLPVLEGDGGDGN